MPAAEPSLWRRLLYVVTVVLTFGQPVKTQNKTGKAITHPSEASALNRMFERWGILANTYQWNISGEICSGVAIDATDIESMEFNPSIKCDCSYDNNSTCHITLLRVYALNVAGPLPDELWNFTYLTNLNLGQNYFTGLLPATIGNLRRLQYLSVGINALSGEVPRELGLLTDLRSISFGINNFHGPLPSELGSLSRLSQIYFNSAGVSGPIPQTFTNLRSLEIVWGSDNELTGQIPDFIGYWSNLSTLRFQGNSFQGPIPASFSNLTMLNDLRISDLSNGSSSLNFLRNMTSLSTLVLRNNNISGSIPSYFDGTVYEDDTEPLGPVTYYVTPTRRWAVSNAGMAIDKNAPEYRSSSSSQFSNTLDSELFQNVRLSAGSLRFYGLGLENGNYTVRLQFAEIINLGARTWTSLGRRVFDIYIQGNLVEKDFDLQRETERVSLRAVSRIFTAQVLENYLEIHLFWAGKGTCCIPIQATYGPLISAISATPNFPTASPSSKKNWTGLIVGIVVPVATATLLSLFALYYTSQRRKRQKNLEHDEFLEIDTRPYTFTYAELRAGTDDFNPSNKLGEGGFGPVYKGTVGDGRVVAVKQLSVASRQGKSQFVAEIATISAVQHRNLVKLHGCCLEGDKRLLVYEYLENKSLDQHLFGTRNRSLHLDWKTRFDICLGVARGLAYLHEESRLRIVHRDVKASNILLDSDLVPKISDFGLAKLYDDKMTHISTRVAGTIGYLAPEYAMRGHLTEKADIFSFGVVALEIVSGRPNSDPTLDDDRRYLLEWAWKLHESNKEIELVDPTLDEYDADEVRRIMGVAFLCTQASPGLRPPMSRVVSMLSEDIEVVSVNTRPGYLNDWSFNDATTFVVSDTTYGSPLNTDVHMDLAPDATYFDPTRPMLYETR